MSIDNKQRRVRRAKKTRVKICQLQMPRLSVHRTSKHIYAQIIMPDGKVIASASTLDAEVKQEIKYSGNVESAKVVGKMIAKRGNTAEVNTVAFDRSGFKYHGRVQALADAAREAGLKF